MGNTSLMLYISFAVPLAMATYISKGKTRSALGFFLAGMTTALFCGELSGLIFNICHVSRILFTVNVTPFIEELVKAIPIVFLAFEFKTSRQDLLEASIMVGVGFAVLENAYILSGEIASLTIVAASLRAFGSGLMHALCTMQVGFALSFAKIRTRLSIVGSLAILSGSIIFHSIYNILVQSKYTYVGVALPSLILIIFIIYNQMEEKKQLQKQGY